MKVDRELLKRLPIEATAQSIVSESVAQFPPLVIYTSLAGDPKAAAASCANSFKAGTQPLCETLSMPKDGFGPRPITMLHVDARALYCSLAELLRPGLPEESRATLSWKDFEAVGREEDSLSQIVQFDIAACYEYIEHPQLAEELVLHTLDAPASTTLTELLGNLYGRPRGLPQALTHSQVLADAYLAVLQRALIRQGWDTYRYADDFKVVVDGWATANAVVEFAAEEARKCGMILAGNKMSIKKGHSLFRESAAAEELLGDYHMEEYGTLRFWFMADPYDGSDPEIDEDALNSEALHASLQRIVNEWVDSELGGDDEETWRHHRRYIGRALETLQDAEDRLDARTLEQVVARRPIHLRRVAEYLLARHEDVENWRVLDLLVASGRQSPWAKLWMLYCARSFNGTPSNAATEWVRRQLDDAHETVRAEAGFTAAKLQLLTLDELSLLASRCTRFSEHAIAAVASASGMQGPVATSLQSRSALCRAAFAWGQT